MPKHQIHKFSVIHIPLDIPLDPLHKPINNQTRYYIYTKTLYFHVWNVV